MTELLHELFGRRPRYEDAGAGAHNAGVLAAARVRPAFVDTSCLMYRLMWAKAAYYVKRCGNDTSRIAHSVAADVMLDIAEFCRNFACAPVLAFDSSRSLRREETYPQYKGNRGAQKKTEKEALVLSCKDEIRRLLRCVYGPGYRVQGFCVNGYESDDVIASFVLGLKQPKADVGDDTPVYDKHIVIVSNDHDLHQLVGDGVTYADVTSGVLCSAEDLVRHYKLRPEEIVAAKCIGGCKSDNVGGVPGCGDKTVAEVIASRSFDVSVTKARRNLASEDGAVVLRRNLRLIRLPYEGSPMLPQLKLSAKVWPSLGIPDEMAALMDSNGIPRSAWPSFADITLPRASSAVPMCSYNKK